jgi:hypothetical protein
MSVTFRHARSETDVLQHPALLLAVVRVIALAGILICQTNGLGGATAAEVQGVVTAPVVAAYDVDPTTATFVFRGSINMNSADGWIAIDVLKDPKADPSDEQNWRYDVGFAQITGSGPDFTFASPPLQIFELARSDPSLRPWIDGGLGRARVAFVFRNDPSQWVLLPVQDEDGITPQNQHVIVFSDIDPDRTNQVVSADRARCVPQDLDNVNDPTNPCTPNYLSANANVLSFPPGQENEQRQATMDYYQQVKTGPRGGGASILAALGTLQKFRQRYFAPFQCNDIVPEAVTTYYNKGDLGIGREMHCINNGCTGELACYVRNFGTLDPLTQEGKAFFGDKAEAQMAVQSGKPFATVAMVERQLIQGSPNSVFFAVYDTNENLQFDAKLDRKGFNTSIPGNCLQCHGINSTYTAHANHEVHRAIFLPFDLDSFEFFSDDPNSTLSRLRQESAFRAQNRMVRNFSRLFRLPDARALVSGWYNDDLFTGTFNGDFVPPQWSGTPQQQQLYLEVYARTCRTCHISYEAVAADAPSDVAGDRRVGLQFGTYQQFLDLWPLINLHACGPVSDTKPMPNAEQTLQLFWTTAARAQLFAQLPAEVPIAFRDCAPPKNP